MKAINRGTLEEWSSENNKYVGLKLQGMDAALIGVCEIHPSELVAVYSYRLIIKELRRRGMKRCEADDHFRFSIKTSFLGRDAPVVLYDHTDMARGDI